MKTAEDIAAYLHSKKAPWIAVLPSDQWLRSSRSSKPSLLFIEVKGGRCETRAALLKHFADRLKFPDYFGHNWDAFEECIGELEWLPAPGYVIVIVEADRLLSRDRDDLQVFVDIMNSVGEAWSVKKPFHTIFVYRSDANEIPPK